MYVFCHFYFYSCFMYIFLQPCCSSLARAALFQGPLLFISSIKNVQLLPIPETKCDRVTQIIWVKCEITDDISYDITDQSCQTPSDKCARYANFQRQSLLRSGCSHQVAPFSVPAVFASSIICMVSLRCIIALFYELLMEVSAQSPDIGRCTTQYQIYLSTPGYT